MWLKRTDGLQSSSFTFVVIAFVIVSLWLLLSIFTELFGLQIREFSGTEAMAYLSPFLMYAWGRKWQEGRQERDAAIVAERKNGKVVRSTVNNNDVSAEEDLTDPDEDEKLTENGD